MACHLVLHLFCSVVYFAYGIRSLCIGFRCPALWSCYMLIVVLWRFVRLSDDYEF